jgi:hypothetical protein
MGFVLGLLTGLLTAIAGFGLLAYWVCTRSNNIAAARFINGIAQALAAQQPKPRPRGETTGRSMNAVEPRAEVRENSKNLVDEG